MNRIEYLLQCIGEEAAEVQQAASKCNRFGINDGYPGTNRNNIEDLAQEITDLVAIYYMLGHLNYPDRIKLPQILDPNKICEKQDRVKKYMEVSRSLGRLEDDNK